MVNKLIKEIVPNIRVSTDARDLLLNCCTGEYVISSIHHAFILLKYVYDTYHYVVDNAHRECESTASVMKLMYVILLFFSNFEDL